jgi:hypothetical protein
MKASLIFLRGLIFLVLIALQSGRDVYAQPWPEQASRQAGSIAEWVVGLDNMAATMRVQPAANGGSLQRIALPAELIMHSQSPNLADLRLFNSSGEPVGFALRFSETESIPASTNKISLKAFPIRDGGSTKPSILGDAAVRAVTRGDDIDVFVGRGAVAAGHGGEDVVVGALLDARSVEGVMTSIDFDLDLPANQVVPITIEASSNLSSWQTLANYRSVYRFGDAGGPVLTSIDLQGGVEIKGRYLRVTWPPQKTATPVAIRGALLTMESFQRVPYAQPRRALGPPSATTARSQEWKLGSPLRIRALVLMTAQTGTLLPITVFGRDTDQQPWRRLAETVLFNLTLTEPVAKQIISTNEPLWLGRVSVRQLKIEVPTSAAAIPTNLIEAFIEYDAQEIIAAVKPAEALIVGVGVGIEAAGAGATTHVQSVALPLQTVVPESGRQRLASLALVAASEAVKFYPERLTSDNSRFPLDRKNMILWGALLLGVGVLAAMAWAVVRQLRTAK